MFVLPCLITTCMYWVLSSCLQSISMFVWFFVMLHCSQLCIVILCKAVIPCVCCHFAYCNWEHILFSHDNLVLRIPAVCFIECFFSLLSCCCTFLCMFILFYLSFFDFRFLITLSSFKLFVVIFVHCCCFTL